MSGLDEIKAAASFGGGLGVTLYFLRWLVNWITGRLDKRAAQLDAEHASLDGSWKGYRLTLEQRVARLEGQNRALSVCFQHVSAALIRIDPANPALQRAEQIMAAAFPMDFSLAVQRAGAALDAED
ncbi:hypothetical protein [Sphingomonas alpina]|uniref:Uncharacterized protein n=1 Tax=Sphingomonas alpina TaxID=653931 RepID=A0A7H0LHT5_9SPHN|nr:hypothetical protein [Sphingomonas alpina]QNQ09238.1 hypothetical protein H3Z74_21630 [Sphingomonas alpina]